MRLPINNRLRQRAFAVELVIAILVIVIGGYVIYKLARLIRNIDKNSNTNTVQQGYATNYGGYIPITLPATIKGVPDYFAGQDSLDNHTFSFNYTVCPSGATAILVNNTNEYKVMVNLTSNLLVMDYLIHTDGSYTEIDTTNAVVDAVVLKSTNMVAWQSIATNHNIDPSQTYLFTDTNAVSACGYYLIQTQ